MQVRNPMCSPLKKIDPGNRKGWKQSALRLFRLLSIATVAIAASVGVAQAQTIEEHDAKAAFMLKLVNFVQWPNEAQRGELVIGFIGADATGDSLQRLAAGKTVEGRSIVVRHLSPDADLRSCQIVFVGAAVSKNLPALLERLRGKTVLTVGEAEGFGQHGGVVNLMLSGGRIRFEINPHAAERAHLQISSRLLSLATLVSDGS